MKNLKHKAITSVPFLMLGVTALSAICSSYGFYFEIYKYLPDSLGYSILTNLVFGFLYWRKSFCKPVWVAVAGLLFMNIVSIVFITSGVEYNTMYDFYIGIVFVFFSLISIHKWF